MSKKEKNAWDRFWLYVKENEKIIWVLLLLLLAPTFAFTGAFSQILNEGRGGNASHASYFGKTIKTRDFRKVQQGLGMVEEVRNVALRYDYSDRHMPIGSDQRSVLDFLVRKVEAERLGLRVSDTELGAEIRRIYRNLKAEEAGMNAARAVKADGKKDIGREQSQAAMGAYYEKLGDLEKQDSFGETELREWFSLLQNWANPGWRGGPIPRREFELVLRDVLLIEKLEDYVKASVAVTPDEAFARYEKDNQTRKFSFFPVEAGVDKSEIEKSVTDADVQARFDKRKEDFRQPLKVRTSYISLPIADFESKVTLTDEDLRKEYDRVKNEKYQTFVGPESPGGFNLESPEDKAKREATAYRPFDEVKDEIRAELIKVRARDNARTTAEQIKGKLFPPKPGAVGKKDETPAPPGATFEEIVKEFPMVKTGTTPWVDRESAEKEIAPEAYSTRILNWFSELTPTSQKPAKKEIERPQDYDTIPSRIDPKYMVFYGKPEVRPAGIPAFADVKDKVRETIVKEKLLDKAKERAKAFADAIKEGKKTFEDAAKEANSTMVTTGFIGSSGSVKIPMTPEEVKKAEEDQKKKNPMATPPTDLPKEKDHPGSSVIVEYGFKTLQEKGKVEGFVEDPTNSDCYIVRWDDVIFPDASQFPEERARYENTLLAEKQLAYLTDWQNKLRAQAQAGFFTYKSAEDTERKGPAPQDPDAE
jgi:hypothetical protein